MDFSAVSPRRASPGQRKCRTKQQRKDHRKELSHTPTEFNALIDEIVQISAGLFKISAALHGKGAKAQVEFTNLSGRKDNIGKQELKSAISTLHKREKELKAIFRASKRSHRDLKPGDFKGVYTPIYCGASLRNFFNAGADGFGPRYPNSNPNGPRLMDSLTYVKGGYMLRNCIILLAYDYFRENDLQGGLQAFNRTNGQYIRSDDHMRASFGGDIDADFYVYEAQGGTKLRVPMAEAVGNGITEALNVYDALATYKPYTDARGNVRMSDPTAKARASGRKPGKPIELGFNPDEFRSYFMQNIASYSFYSMQDINALITGGVTTSPDGTSWQEILDSLNDDGYRENMLNEHTIVQETADEWEAALCEAQAEKRRRKKATA